MADKNTLTSKKSTTTTKKEVKKPSVSLIADKFPKTEFMSLSNSDKKTIAIIKKLMADTKQKKVKIPLSSSIDVEKAKTVSVDVASLIKTQFAICKECSIVYTYEEEKDVNGENFRIYYAVKKPSFALPSSVLREAKKSELKRKNTSSSSSSQKKKDEEVKSKAFEAAESANNNDWNKNASMAIVDHLIGKYHIDCNNRLDLEKEIISILEKIR